jgi:CheY-like chemotaxis protein
MKKKLACILFIDDDEPTNFLNKMIAEETGYAEHVQVAFSGQEALNYLTNSGPFENSGNIFPRPELIFLDINMPGMDGWEFLDEYKNLPAPQKGNIVMVMLTTSLNPEDERSAKIHSEIAGFEHKPLASETLDKIIKNSFPDHI